MCVLPPQGMTPPPSHPYTATLAACQAASCKPTRRRSLHNLVSCQQQQGANNISSRSSSSCCRCATVEEAHKLYQAEQYGVEQHQIWGHQTEHHLLSEPRGVHPPLTLAQSQLLLCTPTSCVRSPFSPGSATAAAPIIKPGCSPVRAQAQPHLSFPKRRLPMHRKG